MLIQFWWMSLIQMMNVLQRKKIPSSRLIFVDLKIINELFNVDVIRVMPFKDQGRS